MTSSCRPSLTIWPSLLPVIVLRSALRVSSWRTRWRAGSDCEFYRPSQPFPRSARIRPTGGRPACKISTSRYLPMVQNTARFGTSAEWWIQRNACQQ